ncbi:MAG: 3-hydroxyacyl-CoA dehydrogenase NAD-binding domain-containing protein [Actinomycetes bacterium]
MASDRSYPGLNGCSDASANISGALVGAGIKVAGAEGVAVGSGLEALSAALWFAYLNEAAKMFEQQYATRDDIDAAMKLGCGYRIGPLRQLDAIGADNAVAVLDALYEASRDPRHKAADVLTGLVAAGNLGQSTGSGFYDYVAPGSSQLAIPEHDEDVVIEAEQRSISKVGVVGTGSMAVGISEVFAKAGYDVIYVARNPDRVTQVDASLKKSLDRAVAKGKLSEEDRDAALARVVGTVDYEDLADVDIVVGAIVENLDTKREKFRTLDRVCKPGAILATTTSSLSVAELAAVTSRPHDVVGMHFFNPAPVMKLVEIVETDATSQDVTATVVELCKDLGKHPVLCGDRAGFIVNFLLFPYLNDAVRAVEAELVTMEDLDPLMKAWQSLPLGPFALLDVVGTDVSLAIEEVIYKAFGGACYAPAPLLKKTVAAGRLGRKIGKGFYDYA